MMNDTIAAIATPQSAGGIGIIRISGADAKNVADAVFKNPSGKKISEAEKNTFLYGKIFENGEIIDEAIALVFSAPNSYTGEDVVELDCHGGIIVTRQVLRAVLNSGARLAEAGEFTKRAFLNNKISLTNAEAVMDIISAKGVFAEKAAQSAREGATARRLGEIKDSLTLLAAKLSVWTDYPDDDAPDIDEKILLSSLTDSKEKLEKLLSEYDSGKAVREGVLTAIVGRPNVGKSTLMNMLSGTDKSIVTEYAGTTRDVIEETVTLGNVILNLMDTAGIRNTDNPVEAIGVKRAKDCLEKAELVLAVFDSSSPLTDGDFELIEECRNKLCAAVINKSDLPVRAELEHIRKSFKYAVEISAENSSGKKELAEAIENILGTSALNPSDGMLANERQRGCAKEALDAVCDAIDALNKKMTFDAVGVCIDSAVSAILRLTGEKATETVVNEVFKRFCVGK
ncbi:MAG: tRNA uridine-5-carboxymethylaminomethyl(34) synthesis GTPase MnmE [Acutalibacteraceae bacterium]